MLTKENAYRKDLTTGIAEMQHRHFATIATIIRETRLGAMPKPRPETDSWARLFADRLAETNSSFDRKRFLLACGVEI